MKRLLIIAILIALIGITIAFTQGKSWFTFLFDTSKSVTATEVYSIGGPVPTLRVVRIVDLQTGKVVYVSYNGDFSHIAVSDLIGVTK